MILDPIFVSIRELGLNCSPSASLSAIAQVEFQLEGQFPDGITSIYLDHDGCKTPAHSGFRMLSLQEVAKLNTSNDEFPLGLRHLGLRAFWANDNSDYFAVFVNGPLRGRVCYVDHEEIICSPIYRSVIGFYKKMIVDSKKDIIKSSDYPYKFEQSVSHLDKGDDLRIANLFKNQLSNDFQTVCGPGSIQYNWRPECIDNIGAVQIMSRYDRFFLASTVMNLTPVEYTPLIYPFFQNEDTWIQAKACHVAGLHRDVDSIKILSKFVLGNKQNVQSAAIKALGEIGNVEAVGILLDSLKTIDTGFYSNIFAALSVAGCSVSKTADIVSISYLDDVFEVYYK